MNTTTLTAPQQAALAAIADGANKTEAARVGGSIATPYTTGPIYHWERTVPGFRDAILHMQQSMAVIEADYQAMRHKPCTTTTRCANTCPTTSRCTNNTSRPAAMSP